MELALFGSIFGLPLVFVVAAALLWNPPRIALATICAINGAGLLLFLAAKVSVIRRGHLVSVGSSRMSGSMRWCYRLGYLLVGLGAALVFAMLRLSAAA